MTDYRKDAEAIREEIVENRRAVHGYAELGLDLPKTAALVMEKLRSYGYEPQLCGKSGVTATVGQGGKVILLRGDMDALPMPEQTGLPFAATNGNCHSCGHDLHTAMLLGAARLLKEHESELKGRVKFMFQPGEEVLGGALEMIEAGLLEDPHVDVAMGMHVTAGGEISDLGLITYKRDYSTYSGDMVKITVNGKNAHGSSPEKGVDAINVAAHIVTALEALHSREITSKEYAMVLTGKIYGGDSCNTEAGTCTLEVSVRACSEEARAFLLQRVKEISEGIAATFRAEAVVDHVYGMPSMYNAPEMCDCVPGYCEELLGKEKVLELHQTGGTEDFTAVAARVPSVYLHIGAGSLAGKDITSHNPTILFDEDVLPIGSAVYAHVAARYLEEHQQ